MDKCKSADRYQGYVKPRCNNGKPCQACKDIYVRRSLETILHSGLDTDPVFVRTQAANALEVL